MQQRCNACGAYIDVDDLEDEVFCDACEELASEYLKRHYDGAIEQLRNCLSEDNRNNLDGLSRQKQENMVDKMVAKGLFKWKIGG